MINQSSAESCTLNEPNRIEGYEVFTFCRGINNNVIYVSAFCYEFLNDHLIIILMSVLNDCFHSNSVEIQHLYNIALNK